MPSPPPLDPRVGKVLQDRYKILRRVAAGAMGVVYRGERVKLGRAVAIKFLHAPFVDEQKFLRRFELEARAMSRLGHPNCVSIIDFGFTDAPFLVMDWVPGVTLREVMDREKIAPVRAVDIARQVLAGLAHAHKQGIIHRDIKPGNIILTEATGTGDHVRLLDFGLAKLHDPALSLAQSTHAVAVGTPSYMPPEQATGAEVDERSDVYSTGVLLFELLARRKPFVGEDIFEVIQKQVHSAVPRVREVTPEAECSEQLESLIAKAMAKEPAERFQTALQLLSALEETPESAPRPRRATGKSTANLHAQDEPESADADASEQPAPPRSRMSWAAVLLMVGLAAAVVAIILVRDARDRASPAGSRPEPGAGTLDAKPRGAAATAPDAAARDIAVAGREAASAAPVDQGLRPPDGRAHDAGPDTRLAGADAKPTPADAAKVAAKPEVAAKGSHHPDSERGERLRASELIRQGRVDAAIKLLRERRRRHGRTAYIPYLLGQLYFRKRYYRVGLRHYLKAVKRNRVYAQRAVLIKDATRALAHRRTARAASRLLRRYSGRAALHHLKRVARRTHNRSLRSRAIRLIRRIRRGR